uniref:Uncharacterized protein n=1 Tax=Arundo donax TaxID=35708 RepID=A0A0A9UCX7_ARUDO
MSRLVRLLLVCCILAWAPKAGQQGDAATTSGQCDYAYLASQIAGFCTSTVPSPHCCSILEKVMQNNKEQMSCIRLVAEQPDMKHLDYTEALLADIFHACFASMPPSDVREPGDDVPKDTCPACPQATDCPVCPQPTPCHRRAVGNAHHHLPLDNAHPRGFIRPVHFLWTCCYLLQFLSIGYGNGS